MTDGQFRLHGPIYVDLTADEDDFAPPDAGKSTLIYLTGDGDHQITGVKAEAFAGNGNEPGRVLWFFNYTTDRTFGFPGHDSGSDPENRLDWTGTLTIQRGEALGIVYNDDENLWRLLAIGKLGGGGGGGTPGGADTQVQFNDGGAFGGDSALSFDKSTDITSATHLRVTGTTQIAGDVSATLSSSPQHNLAPTGHAAAGVLRINPDTVAVDVTGITAPASGFDDGRLFVVENVGTGGFPLNLLPENAGSTDINRFALSGPVAIRNNESALLRYDGVSDRWRLLAMFGKTLIGSRIVSDGSFQGFYDQNGNELLQTIGVGSAVNHPLLTNAATGSGPTLTPGTGGDSNVDLNVSGRGTGVVNVGITGGLRALAGRGTSNPATTSPGADFYRTDLNEAFYFDASRSKWLSYSRDQQHFGRAGAGISGDLRGYAGATLSTTHGYHVPFDCVLVGISWSGAAYSSATLVINNGATPIVTKSALAANNQDMALNVDLAEGDKLNATISAGTIDQPVMTVYLRRRSM